MECIKNYLFNPKNLNIMTEKKFMADKSTFDWVHEYITSNPEALKTYRTISIMLEAYAASHPARTVGKVTDEEIEAEAYARFNEDIERDDVIRRHRFCDGAKWMRSTQSGKDITFPKSMYSPSGNHYLLQSVRDGEARYEGINDDTKRHTIVYSQMVEQGYKTSPPQSEPNQLTSEGNKEI